MLYGFKTTRGRGQGWPAAAGAGDQRRAAHGELIAGFLRRTAAAGRAAVAQLDAD